MCVFKCVETGLGVEGEMIMCACVQRLRCECGRRNMGVCVCV